jgi:hypothetical protein
LGFFRVKCEVVGPGVRPLISAWIIVLSSSSRIRDLYYTNLTKFRSGSLYFCLQLYRSDDSRLLSHGVSGMLALILF